MGENICEEIRLVDNILQAEDFIRLAYKQDLLRYRWSIGLQNGLMKFLPI